VGRTRASTARRSGKSPSCLLRSSRRSGPRSRPSTRFRYYPVRRTHGAPSMAASRSRAAVLQRPTGGGIGQRVPGAVERSACSASWHPRQGSSCASTWPPAPRGWHRLHDNDRPARTTPSSTVALLARRNDRRRATSVPCVPTFTSTKGAAWRPPDARRAGPREETTGPAVVDEAAKAAPRISACRRYRLSPFRRYHLERRLPAPLTLRQVDPASFRQLTLLIAISIDRKTGDPR